MFEEIQLLKENLDGESRGDHVKAVREKAASLIQLEDWKGVDAFFFEFLDAFKDTPSVLGILKREFHSFCQALFSRISELESVVLLNRLQSFPWFETIEDVNFKRGVIAENLALYSSGGGLIELQTARRFYRKAHRIEDVSRVQASISEKARSFNLWAPIVPPASLVATIHSGAVESLGSWRSQADEVRLTMLATDYFGIRPSNSDEVSPSSDSIPELLHHLGVIQSIEISSDGRISAGKGASPSERIEFDAWDFTHRVFLDVFLPEVKIWLNRAADDPAVWKKVFATLRSHLNWDENSSEHFYEGLSAWIQGFPQVALSFWLPNFESVLRNRLADLGEDVICLNDKAGLEDFITFDGLLRSANNHYDIESIKYWRRIFSKENGLGWNLRHSFCHGLLPLRAMRVEIYAFAVFQAYLFLIRLENEISDDSPEPKDE